MINRYLRDNRYVAGVLAIIRIYLGWSWLTSGWHKVVDGFDAGGYLGNAVANPVVDRATEAVLYPTYTAFLEKFALPNVELINILIPWGEVLVGLGLIVGCFTTAAMFFGLLMNFMFLFAGTTSTNPWMVLLGALILAAGANAGKYGADYFVLPYIRKIFKTDKKKDVAA